MIVDLWMVVGDSGCWAVVGCYMVIGSVEWVRDV